MHPPVLGLAHGVTVPVPVDPSGRLGPTKRAAAGAGWRRTSRGRYVPAHIPLTPAQRVAEAGVLLPPRFAAVTGWATLCWLGASWHTGRRADGSTRRVDLTMSRHLIRPQPLIRLREERYDVHGFLVEDGLRTVPAVVAVTFEMRYAHTLAHAVEALDMAYAADLVTPEEVSSWVDQHPSYVGIQRARDAVHRADENAWSPQEVHLRLAWEEARRVRPLTNRPVFDLGGRHLGTPDLIDPVTGVVGEYDGDTHLDRARRRVDLAREERLRQHGLEPVTFVAGGLGPGSVGQRLRAAYARAARVPSGDRTWTLDPPHWWVPTSTVAQRRALADAERSIWLRRAG